MRHRDDRGFDVDATLFPQSRKLQIGPISAAEVNPILLIFFQRDVTQMSNGTGGSQHYFRNTIRRVLQTSDPASIRDTTIDLGDERVAATRSEEHTSEIQSLMRHSYAVFCLKEKNLKQLV